MKTMYQAYLERLFSLNGSKGVKLGLQNPEQLRRLLHYPDRTFDSVHVAGTNGKGSVTGKIADAFEAGGYTAGLYTSPHISCFRERIRVNGVMISESDTESILGTLFSLIDLYAIPATFFELTTCAAFVYFAQKKVDVAVIETGLGGRLDATNVILPRLSIITSIGFDHTEILGDTLEKITDEKAGIVKYGVPVVIGPKVPLQPVQKACKEKNSELIRTEPREEGFEKENEATASTALGYLKQFYPGLSGKIIRESLKNKPPCRFEILEGRPVTILDVAHNPPGLKALFQSAEKRFPGRSFDVLFGLSANKDIDGCLDVMIASTGRFHLVKAPNERGIPTSELSKRLLKRGVVPESILSHSGIKEGLQIAMKQAAETNRILIVCGSFFIMSQVRSALGFREPTDPFDLNESFNEKNTEFLPCF